jgi:hypothetical protein
VNPIPRNYGTTVVVTAGFGAMVDEVVGT